MSTIKEEGKMLYLASPALIPMLERRREGAVNRLLGEYRAGATELRNFVAALSATDEILNDIKSKIKAFHTESNKGE